MFFSSNLIAEESNNRETEQPDAHVAAQLVSPSNHAAYLPMFFSPHTPRSLLYHRLPSSKC